MGTTKLTRKEILAEDPIHAAIIRLVEVSRSQGRTIALVAAVAVLLVVGAYFGMQYLGRRDMRAQMDLAKAMDLFHAQIDPEALDDPYAKGPQPIFRNEEARYQAAGESFRAFLEKYGSGQLSVIARYYLGLTRMKLDQTEEGLRLLEEVRNNTRDRTVGYLAKKVLATYYLDLGRSADSIVILEGMLQDPQCELPRAALRVDLARAYIAADRKDDARKVIQEARDDAQGGTMDMMVRQDLERLEKRIGGSPQEPARP